MRGLRDLIEWCGWWRCQTLANTGAADCTAARFAVRHALLGCVVVPVDSVHSSVQISEQQPWQCSALCALRSALCALCSTVSCLHEREQARGSGRARESAGEHAREKKEKKEAKKGSGDNQSRCYRLGRCVQRTVRRTYRRSCSASRTRCTSSRLLLNSMRSWSAVVVAGARCSCHHLRGSDSCPRFQVQ